MAGVARSSTSGSARREGEALEIHARGQIVKLCFKVFPTQFVMNPDSPEIQSLLERLAAPEVAGREFSEPLVKRALAAYTPPTFSAGKFGNNAKTLEVDVLLKLAEPAHGWWAPPGEGLDGLRFVAPEPDQQLPPSRPAAPLRSSGSGGSGGGSSGSSDSAGGSRSAGVAPVVPSAGGTPQRSTRSSKPATTPPEFRSDASMYVVGEAWNASPSTPGVEKLAKIERLLCALEEHTGKPVEDCVLGVLAVGPHMTPAVCAQFAATVSASMGRDVPRLSRLMRLRRFLGWETAPLDVGTLGLRLAALTTQVDALAGLPAQVGTLAGIPAQVVDLSNKVEHLTAQLAVLFTLVKGLAPAHAGDTAGGGGGGSSSSGSDAHGGK